MFNGRGDSGEDFIYPPTEGAKPAAGLLSNRGKCKTECRDYDTLVSAGWTAAIELYSRTFPERELPWLDNWPRRARENG